MLVGTYDAREIEARWQRLWAEERTWELDEQVEGSGPGPAEGFEPASPGGHEAAPPQGAELASYVLEMVPYPSGEPHLGHLKLYSLGDAVAHYARRRGRRVLHAVGYDAFGLPAENHAVRTGTDPQVSTDRSIAEFQSQLRAWGISVDWRREFGTHEPSYYRWTQWIFLEMLERGLAYRKEAAVQWCPVDQTVLANEQVVGGNCERCGTPVEIRRLTQWFLRITDYAERLLDDLDALDWPAHVKVMQRNWIGRSEGAEVIFRCAETGQELPIFTTRPDALFGATFFVMGPEHPDVLTLAASTPHEASVRAYVEAALGSPKQRDASAPKTGVPLGRHAINPVNGELLPMYVADYILMEYGTGAVMGVPAHDLRDHEFAEVFDLPSRSVVVEESRRARAADDALDEAPEGARATADGADEQPQRELPYTGEGLVVNSGEFDGLQSPEARECMIAWLEREGAGRATVQYRLQDWLISRQRYWGCPVPIVHCDTCGIVPIADEQLPVVLPKIEDYAPRGRSPLASAQDWVSVACPRCGGPARRETDTMDTFVDSSWYFLRHCDPANAERAWDPQAIARWLPVTHYLGGVEHAILHLLYARFFMKVLADMGLVPIDEPFGGLFTQGMITREGTKMSKSRGNAISPRVYVERYGADTARCFILFMGPPDQDADWSDARIESVHRFLERLWRLGEEIAYAQAAPTGSTPLPQRPSSVDRALLEKMHATIQKVTESMDAGLRTHTAIAAIMELVNEANRKRTEVAAETLATVTATAASLLFAFAPHVSAEVYERITGRRVWEEPWPVADPAFLLGDELEVIVQVDGKLCDRVSVSTEALPEEVKVATLASPRVRARIDGSEILKEVVVPGKLVNFVTRPRGRELA